MMFKNLIFICCLLLVFSCSTKKEILYLQDVDQHHNTEIKYTSTTIQPNDILRINVSALIPESTIPYNRVADGGSQTIELMQLDGYLVSEKLTINFPVLGLISVKAMTPLEFSDFLKKKLEAEGHLKNPSVSVRVINAKVMVLGEVNNPGTYNFTEQNITLLQALANAGDLAITGKREDITVIREEDGLRKIGHVDLTSSDWLDGEFGYVKPNDVIIVNPSNPKVKSAGFVGSLPTLFSVVSIVLTTVLLISN
ncbi:polysaccharide biosynthesis/export family protein [Winogradskyella sp. PAMC22761]|nr:polysaccharide biosynthesis/export family protein [Winogradskyella sp. PAMC22761]